MNAMTMFSTSNRVPWIIVTLLVCIILTMLVVPATAQKSKKPQPAQTTTASSLRDVLVPYQGKMTNKGTLVKVTSEYFSLEDEGVTSIHPMSAIHTLKITKDEEAATTKLDIKLVATE
jgi:hypothetical protein